MVERDPRLQLYPVALDCLQRMDADFHNSPHGDTYEWTGFYSQQKQFIAPFDFSEPHSTIEADSAAVTALFFRTDDASEITINLQLFRDGSPYNRERDVVTGCEVGQYDVVLAEEIPPTLLPSGLYDSIGQSLADLYEFTKSGVGELVGVNQARNLLEVIGSFTIDQIDLSDFEPK